MNRLKNSFLSSSKSEKKRKKNFKTSCSRTQFTGVKPKAHVKQTAVLPNKDEAKIAH